MTTNPPPRTGPRRRAAGTGETARPPGSRDTLLATLSYLAVPFLGPLVPAGIYLARKRASGYVRRHSAQALNLSITMLLYAICALILAAMLALDSITVALAIVVPLAAVLWLAVLGYVIVTGSRANRGEYYPIPAWLCASLVR